MNAFLQETTDMQNPHRNSPRAQHNPRRHARWYLFTTPYPASFSASLCRTTLYRCVMSAEEYEQAMEENHQTMMQGEDQ